MMANMSVTLQTMCPLLRVYVCMSECVVSVGVLSLFYSFPFN